jgi:hypothetical protein
MEAILQMCTPINGVIEKASLPSRSQLNMHIDADEFFVRVQRGRFRRSIPIQCETGRETDKTENVSGRVASKAVAKVLLKGDKPEDRPVLINPNEQPKQPQKIRGRNRKKLPE